MAREIIPRPPRPSERARGRVARARFVSGRFDAFVEHHDDVRAERDFDFERFLGRKKMLGAVEVRAERDAVIGHLAQFAQAENLKAAGIGEDRMRPGHEPVQPAHRANQLMAGTQVKVIGVSEKNLHAELFEVLLRLALHRCRRAHRHKRRRFDHAVRRREAPEARAGRIGRENFKLKWHRRSVSG